MARHYAGIDQQYTEKDTAKIFLQSIPYDGTSTWGKGADKGFEAFLDASENMELFDIETSTEVYKEGVYIWPDLGAFESPEDMYQRVYQQTKDLLKSGKFLSFFGGEHSISMGIIKAFNEKFENLTVLQIDAHTDLRPSYGGTAYNHACAVFEANQECNLIQVGIRSMDILEDQYLNRSKCYFMHDIAVAGNDWMDHSINQMTDHVYITLDLDAFDPSIMPATGTPEPGGFLWYNMLQYLKKVFKEKNVLGFDIVELAPIDGFRAPEFLVAKLYYKMLTYKFLDANNN